MPRAPIEPTSDGHGLMPRTVVGLLRFQDKHRPFPGLDVTGMPTDLATAETSALRRLSPRRNRWPDVAAFDQRVAELEARQTAITAELAGLHTRAVTAPADDAEALGKWQLAGEKGPRPEPTLPAIEAEISEAQANFEGLTVASARVLGDKALFVQQHRKRLVRDADAHAGQAHAHMLALVDQLAQARQALADARESACWAALYPSEAAGRHARHQMLAGGLRRPLERLGLAGEIPAERVLDVLKEDADWLLRAASPEQRAAMQGQDARTGGAAWDGTDEAKQADRAERDLVKRRHIELWGREPGEWDSAIG